MDTLEISKATDWQEVRRFYHSLIDGFRDAEYHPMWQKDIYPAPEDLEAAVSEGSLFVGRVNAEIAAAMVVNQKSNPEYAEAKWRKKLASREFLVIHMLGVHSRYTGRGYAKTMVRYAISMAEKAGMKAVRLDVLEGNVPAERLYPSVGFQYVETKKLYYEDTGWMNFELYEYVL